MRPIPPSDVQGLLRNELMAFLDFCKRNELTFFLDYGTLLGAVRHKGFIPWDDDVDVVMLREDYDRLMELAKTDPYIDSERRYRISLPGEGKNLYPFVKLVDDKTVVYEKNISRKYAQGVWIDVFCMIYTPDDAKETERVFSNARFWMNVNKILVCDDVQDGPYKKIYPLAKVVAAVLRAVGINESFCRRKMVEAYDQKVEKSGRLSQVSWPGVIEKDSYPASLWDEVVWTDFEGSKLPIPGGFDEILTRHYGDYMQLPPEEQRVPKHDFDGYYL